jgi:hypothetical protein
MSPRPVLQSHRSVSALRRAAAFILLLAAGGCSGDELTLPGERDPIRMVVQSGDRQTGAPSGLLEDPLSVRVVNALDQPVREAVVVFEPENGIVSPDTVLTDAQGRASTRWILGASSGTQRARARLGDTPLVEVTFTADADATARAQLALLTQPAPVAQSGVPLEQQPRVRVTDLAGNPLSEPGVTVVAALASGGGTLRGTTTVLTDAGGIARFTDLALEGSDGPHTLIFAAVGLTSVAAPQIVVRADPVPAASIEITEHTPETSDVGRSVFFRIRISPEPSGQPSDSSFFLNASTGESCRGSIFDRTCGLIFNSPGERTIVATLPAVDGRQEAASAPVRHVVNEVENPTRTSVGVTPDPARSDQRLTVFVKVVAQGGEGARGSVVLYLDGGGCGRGELLGQIFELNSNGEGTFRIGPLDPGYHEVRGCYTGALGFAPSEDLASVTVNP